MTEGQERRYICKICNKSCKSRQSLGGHMRGHLFQNSASEKAEKVKKSESKMEFEGGDFQLENSENQSNSINLGEKIGGFGEDDPNNSYELRENPKKTWRMSDSGNGDSKKEIFCKECGREFSSLRALSGHMRSHSIKNSELNNCECEECGREFGSIRALYGHMKCHRKRSRVPDDSTETLSDLELRPIRKKRSSLRRYKFGEVEKAATCLMMLSRSVRNSNVTECSNKDSGFCGAESVCRSEGIAGKKNDGDKMLRTSESVGKIDSCISGSANAFSDKNVSDFDDFGYEFVNEHEMKVPSQVSAHDLPSINISKESNESAAELDHSDYSDLRELGTKAMMIGGAMTRADLVHLKSSSSDQETVHAMIAADLAPLKSSSSDQESIGVGSSQALGVSDSVIKVLGDGTSVEMDTSMSSVDEINWKLDGLKCNENRTVGQESIRIEIVNFELTKSKDHECPMCFKVFSSGQALGGHKRAHCSESKAKKTMEINQELPDLVPDLNFPLENVGLETW
ncbi:uncharacterized protein Fot_05841 [Forsythia ovata]|uniref:C2H2-type domain-containing protein n=1 Tax=Forsythia ovata TaxID=205694 RepID=A0ABD1WR89_9LAMI